MSETNHQPQEPMSADAICATMVKEMDRYRPESEDGLPSTEEQLGLERTELRQVEMPGRHKLWVLDETGQPTGAYKVNGMEWFVEKLLSESEEFDEDNRPSFHIGSAGNAGAGLVHAAARRGLRTEVETPSNLVPMKRKLLEGPYSRVNAVHDSVEASTARARQAAEEDPNGVFVHGFNNFDVIVGQSMVAQRAIRSMLQQDARGRMNLADDNVRILVQRGGGSLITGFACAVRKLKDEGVLGDNVQVYVVRPEESPERYDGLYVKAPGELAQTIIDDPRYVAGTIYIDDVDTGTASRDMAHAFHGTRFEPSGVAGVAGFKRLQSETVPTVNISVLTGRNYSDESYKYFSNAALRRQRHLLHVDLPSRMAPQTQDDPYKTINQPRYVEPKTYGRFPIS